MPVVNIGNKNKDILVPAEVCEIRPGQRFKKRLSAADTTAFMQLSVSKPGDRLRSIQGAVANNVSCCHIHIESNLSSYAIFEDV